VVRARTTAKQSPSTSFLFPSPQTAPRWPASAAVARADGMAGCRADVRAREPPRGNLLGGNTPIAPAGDAAGVVAAIGGRPRCPARQGVQS
jgi:hypothetical protein